MLSGSRREYGLNYLSDGDLSSLVVDAEGRKARFVTITFRVCSGYSRLIVLTYWTLGQMLSMER